MSHETPHCKTDKCHGPQLCICDCGPCHTAGNENIDLVSGDSCQHKSTHEETWEEHVAQWVPSWDEEYDENDPQRTVTYTHGKVVCNDCGEILDVSYGY